VKRRRKKERKQHYTQHKQKIYNIVLFENDVTE